MSLNRYQDASLRAQRGSGHAYKPACGHWSTQAKSVQRSPQQLRDAAGERAWSRVVQEALSLGSSLIRCRTSLSGCAVDSLRRASSSGFLLSNVASSSLMTTAGVRTSVPSASALTRYRSWRANPRRGARLRPSSSISSLRRLVEVFVMTPSIRLTGPDGTLF